MALLSSDLVSPLGYTAGEELDFNLHFEAPPNTTTEKFYVLGGLYTDTTYLSGSLFGILKVAELDYGVNSAAYLSTWELDPEEAVELPCKFILNRTNCLLALFLMRMVGDEPNIDDDEVVAQIQVQLTAVIPFEEQFGNVVSQSILPLIGIALVSGVVGILMGRKSKEGS